MATNQDDSSTQASDQRLRHLFGYMPICIIVVDLTVLPAVILEVNRRTELLFGYTALELVGTPIKHLVPEESRASLLNIIQRIQRGETVTAETKSKHRDGTIFPVRGVATLDPFNSGQMIITIEDITAEKQRRSEAEAIDAERLRIAHEIHDGVAQSLGGLRFKSVYWSHLAESAPPGMRAALGEMQDVLNTAIADIRRAIFALRPVDLQALGFFPALTQRVTDFGDQNQMVARLDISGSQGDLPGIYELPLFRIIQEGLHNVGQHAHASSVKVHIDIDSTRGVAVTVNDNGRGFDPTQLGPADYPGHFGLRQMRERIIALGGTLDIHSAIGKGTELVITLPPIVQEVNHAVD